jgi:hypothetical protein
VLQIIVIFPFVKGCGLDVVYQLVAQPKILARSLGILFDSLGILFDSLGSYRASSCAKYMQSPHIAPTAEPARYGRYLP